MRSKKIGIFPILCLIALTAGVTYAVVKFTLDVPMTLEIAGEYDLAVFNPDMSPLTSIDFGELQRNDGDSIGGFWLENTGVDPAYFSFSLTGWPGDVSIDMEIFDDIGALLDNLDPEEVTTWRFEPGVRLMFNINYDVAPDAVAGPYSPTLHWNLDDGN